MTRLCHKALLWCRGLRFSHKLTIDGVKIYIAANKKTTTFFREKKILAYMVAGEVFLQSKKHLTPTIIAHEMEHVYQERKQPWTFFVRYWWETVRVGYDQNSYEKEAVRAEKANASRYRLRLRATSVR